MPASLNGIGTGFYGSCDFQPNGSYVTTEWVIVAYLPIIPLRSLRIAPTGEKSYVVAHQTTYQVYGTVPFHWGQVGRVYLFVVALGLLITGALELNGILVRARLVDADPLSDVGRTLVAFVLAFAIPFTVRSILQRRALRRAGLTWA